MTRPAVILVGPREEGNIGAVCRAMANMGLSRLLLVEPAPELGGVARGFGVGGWHILEAVERFDSFEEAIAPFRRVVGTSSRRARPLGKRPLLTPDELMETVAADAPETQTALVFGPEDNGLTRHQLELCHPVVTIPCDPEHPTLNLAQAVLILAYEWHKVQGRDPGAASPVDPPPKPTDPLDLPATPGEIDAMLGQTDGVLHTIGYDQDPIRRGLLRDLRRLAVRGEITSRETRILRRLLNRTATALGLR